MMPLKECIFRIFRVVFVTLLILNTLDCVLTYWFGNIRYIDPPAAEIGVLPAVSRKREQERKALEPKNITRRTTVGTYYRTPKRFALKTSPMIPVNTSLPCKLPDNLGKIKANTTRISMFNVKKLFWDNLDSAGIHEPKNCTATHRVAIIVPFRNRNRNNLAIFLRHMHHFLMRQRLEYGIYVIEQVDNLEFNKGVLYNAAFTEIRDLMGKFIWDCFIFHDVDLLPLDERNLYTCSKQPKHMVTTVALNGTVSKYVPSFGGVMAITHEQFSKVNGFSNLCPGFEDEDMTKRLRSSGFFIMHPKRSVAKYAMLPHEKRPRNKNPEIQSLQNSSSEGLNSVNGYSFTGIVENDIYTVLKMKTHNFTRKQSLELTNHSQTNYSNSNTSHSTEIPITRRYA